MPGQLGLNREAPRTRLKLTGNVTCRTATTGAMVVDLSEDGVALQLTYDIGAVTGQSVAIDSEELGRLSGIVQWVRGDKIGVRLTTSSNTAAKIASYFKHFR